MSWRKAKQLVKYSGQSSRQRREIITERTGSRERASASREEPPRGGGDGAVHAGPSDAADSEASQEVDASALL